MLRPSEPRFNHRNSPGVMDAAVQKTYTEANAKPRTVEVRVTTIYEVHPHHRHRYSVQTSRWQQLFVKSLKCNAHEEENLRAGSLTSGSRNIPDFVMRQRGTPQINTQEVSREKDPM